MGDTIIVADDDKPKPPPEVIVVAPKNEPKVDKVVTERTTVVETEKD